MRNAKRRVEESNYEKEEEPFSEAWTGYSRYKENFQDSVACNESGLWGKVRNRNRDETCQQKGRCWLFHCWILLKPETGLLLSRLENESNMAKTNIGNFKLGAQGFCPFPLSLLHIVYCEKKKRIFQLFIKGAVTK